MENTMLDFDSKSWIMDLFTHEKTLQNNFLSKLEHRKLLFLHYVEKLKLNILVGTYIV